MFSARGSFLFENMSDPLSWQIGNSTLGARARSVVVVHVHVHVSEEG